MDKETALKALREDRADAESHELTDEFPAEYWRGKAAGYFEAEAMIEGMSDTAPGTAPPAEPPPEYSELEHARADALEILHEIDPDNYAVISSRTLEKVIASIHHAHTARARATATAHKIKHDEQKKTAAELDTERAAHSLTARTWKEKYRETAELIDTAADRLRETAYDMRFTLAENNKEGRD